MKLRWKDHDEMLESVIKATSRWSEEVQTEDGTRIREADWKVQKLICNKVRRLARVCQLRVESIVN